MFEGEQSSQKKKLWIHVVYPGGEGTKIRIKSSRPKALEDVICFPLWGVYFVNLSLGETLVNTVEIK